MAESNVIGFTIKVNGQDQVVKSVGDMKKLLKEANFELLAAQKNFGDYSSEAVEAAKKVAELKDSIQEAAETADLFDPGKKFQTFAGAISAVGGGISAVQGALGLVGAESENVEKALLRVQSALALSQGLNTIADSAKDFQRLGAIIQQTTIFQKANNAATAAAVAVQRLFGVATVGTGTAFKVLKVAIASTGIGLLVVGLGLLVANFDKVKKAVMNLVPGLASIGKLIGNIVNAVTDFVGVTSEAERSLDSFKKKTQDGNQAIEDRIKVLQAQSGKEEEIYKLSKQIANNELEVLKRTQKVKGQLSEEESKRRRELLVEQQVLDAQETKRKNDLAKQEADKAKERAKKDAEERKKQAEERAKNEEDAQNRLKQIADENYLNSIKDETERQKAKVKLDYDNAVLEIQALEISESTKSALLAEEKRKRNLQLFAIDEEFRQKQKEIDKAAEDARIKAAEKAAEDHLKNLETLKTRNQERIDLTAQLTIDGQTRELAQLENEYAKKRALIAGNEAAEAALTEEWERKKAEIKMKYEDFKLNVVKNALNNIATIVGKETIAGKAIAVASATIDTYQAANKALKADYGPFGPAAQVARFISVAATIGAGIKNIREIVKTKVPTVSGAGGGGITVPTPANLPTPAAAPIAPLQQATVTQLDQGTINRLGSATNRAYVVETDISNSQERIRRINRAARLV
jgi:hypothetical protein